MLIAALGLLFTARINLGPTLMAFAVLLAVYARISQARALAAKPDPTE